MICGVERAARWSLALLGVGVLAVALHVSMSIAIAAEGPSARPATPTKHAMANLAVAGEPAVRTAARWLKDRMRADPLPILLPLALIAAVTLRWRKWRDVRRRDLTLMLLSLWLAARSRRGFEGTEWFDFVFGLPAGVLFIELVCERVDPARRRALLMLGLSATILAGAFEYRTASRGSLSRRVLPAFETERGTVHWPRHAIADYRRLQALLSARDPAGRRPLFAFGYAGGFSYFLDRENPAPVTQDFYFSNFRAEDVVRRIASAQPPAFLLDNPFLRAGFPARRVDLAHWEPTAHPGVYETFDRPLFDALRAPCSKIELAERFAFTLYDCPSH